jgi:hypothetical protein
MDTAYFCGIDVSKDTFSVAIKNGSFFLKDTLFPMDSKGFKRFENVISKLKPCLFIGMESTGIYHKNLFNFLYFRGYNTIEIDPYKMVSLDSPILNPLLLIKRVLKLLQNFWNLIKMNLRIIKTILKMKNIA